MNTDSSAKSARPAWAEAVAQYQTPIVWTSVWQIVNSFVPFVVIWTLAYRALAVSYWLTLALAVLGAGFMARMFIIQHDCGHGSFFKSKNANDVVGSVLGVLTLTPYFYWRRQHSIHHATAGNLDKRGVGDVYTMTVREYLQSSKGKRIGYRLFRHPLITFGLGPTYMFLLSHRLPLGMPKTFRRERASVYWTDLAILALVIMMGLLVGFKEFAMVQLPMTLIAATVGVWMFYVQHQFEGTYWARGDQWDFSLAGLKGSSYYKLPQVLQWFTGNIGLHHIHHLSPKTPNYLLQKCLDENPILQVKPLTLLSSCRCIFMNLWDEQQERMVSFGSLRSLPQAD
jgi:omega-6 fatty acid desaturase (delta-12 desaturase)